MAAPTEQAPAPRPIPTRSDFPVHWDPPEEQQLFWTWDKMHFPDPMPALDARIMADVHNFSFNVAFDTVGIPMRYHLKVANGYAYTAASPKHHGPPTPDQEAAMLQGLQAAVGNLGRHWEADMLPEVRRHIEELAAFDLRVASLPALIAHFDQTWQRLLRLWEIHFELAIPMLLGMGLFGDLHQDLFGDQGTFAPYKMLQGFDNKAVEAGRALWVLSRRAVAKPEVRRVLEEQAAEDIIPSLERFEAGRQFLAAFDAYLDEFGQRGDRFIISPPSWVEDPRPALRMLKDYVGRTGYDPDVEQAALAAEREEAIAQARSRLQSYPRPVQEQFEGMLVAAQVALRLQEDHNYWIDQRAMYQVRRVIMEVGRRFVEAGVLAQPGDAFYLTPEEMHATADALPTLDRRAMVAERASEYERQRHLQPPPAIGTMPPGPPPTNPMVRAMGRFWGAPPRPVEDSKELLGNAGAPGNARGPARVVRSLAEAGKLQPGDILVTETTAPPWTPLFATAAAVVTDTGGILSHCAIVAREYRIPAVVGTGMATAILKDGQMVEVDGDSGVVRRSSNAFIPVLA